MWLLPFWSGLLDSNQRPRAPPRRVRYQLQDTENLTSLSRSIPLVDVAVDFSRPND